MLTKKENYQLLHKSLKSVLHSTRKVILQISGNKKMWLKTFHRGFFPLYFFGHSNGWKTQGSNFLISQELWLPTN